MRSVCEPWHYARLRYRRSTILKARAVCRRYPYDHRLPLIPSDYDFFIARSKLYGAALKAILDGLEHPIGLESPDE